MAVSHKCRPLIAEGQGSYSRVIRFDARKEKMTIRKVEIERFSVTSSKPFEAVVAALEAAVGRPDGTNHLDSKYLRPAGDARPKFIFGGNRHG